MGNNATERISNATKTVADSLAPASGFYLVGQELNSPGEATLDVYFEGEGATRRFVLKQIGGRGGNSVVAFSRPNRTAPNRDQ